MNNQRRVILIFGLLSSLLAFFTAYAVIKRTEIKIFDSYKTSSLMTVKTLAFNSADIIYSLPAQKTAEKLKQYTQNLLTDNDDIEYISYKDNNSEEVLTAGRKNENFSKNSFLVNVPMYADNKL